MAADRKVDEGVLESAAEPMGGRRKSRCEPVAPAFRTTCAYSVPGRQLRWSGPPRPRPCSGHVGGRSLRIGLSR